MFSNLLLLSDPVEDILGVMFLVAIVVIVIMFVMIVKLRREVKQNALISKKDEEIKMSFFNHLNSSLRTPLSSIDNSCEALEEGESKPLSEEERNKIINDIQRNSHQAFSFLNEMQELTNFEGVMPVMSMVEVNLAELIISYRREILHETRNGVMVFVSTDMSPHVKVTLDTTMFRQLIMHLLRLGAKRTKEGRITITYQHEDDGLRFWLNDTGDAVSPELCSQLFSSDLKESQFTHLDFKTTVSSLNICKSIVEGMGGTIEAAPGKDGKGITVIFWIPCHVSEKKPVKNSD